eukprot:2927177-Lingulodinium_polyedra.AAC.1
MVPRINIVSGVTTPNNRWATLHGGIAGDDVARADHDVSHPSRPCVTENRRNAANTWLLLLPITCCAQISAHKPGLE